MKNLLGRKEVNLLKIPNFTKNITNDDLTKYKHMKERKKEIEKKINNLKKQIEKIKEEGTVKDKVRGGLGGTQSFCIEGFPTPQYDRLILALETKKAIWRELYVQIEETEVNIELFLANITLENPAMARIIDMRFIEDMTWKEIAIRIGGKATEDSVKKAFERFMKKQKVA